MKNPFEFSNDNKRYHTLYYHNMQKFGGRVYKAVIDGGFTCPNIDGKCGFGGCTYCICGGGEFTKPGSIREQYEKEKERIFSKKGNVPLIAYFQANTNTYAPLEKLKEIYDEVLTFDNLKGISIGTRADCLDDEKIAYLKEVSKKTYLTVELGLQTVFDETAKIINRCHSFDCFCKTYKKLKENNIRVCIHLINGLPFETKEMMIKSAKTIGELKPDAVKIHLLHIMQGSKILDSFLKGEFKEMSFDDYIETVVKQLEYIPKETVIERITGDGSKDKLIAPIWSKNKIAVLGGIDKALFINDTYQGKNLERNNENQL